MSHLHVFSDFHSALIVIVNLSHKKAMYDLYRGGNYHVSLHDQQKGLLYPHTHTRTHTQTLRADMLCRAV